MPNESNAYASLLQKLDEFIRKYYKNQLIRGSIYFITGLIAAFILVSVLEYFGHFDSQVRAGIFFSFLTFSLYIFIRFVLIPLAHLNRLGKRISYEQASSIIGTHFSEVQDKLLNTLQLQSMADQQGSSLMQASIDQKIQELRPVPFTAAINLRANLRYARYALIPLVLLTAILIIAPGMITDSSERLIKYGEEFEEQMPYSINILNQSMEAVQYEDFKLEVKLDGQEIPNDAYVVIGGNSFKMKKGSTVRFDYTFKNLQANTPFQILADGFYSKQYTINVLPKPLILNFDVDLKYPAYTGKNHEQFKNTGELTIPAGTQVNWNFRTKDVDFVNLHFSDTAYKASRNDEGLFSFGKRFLNGDRYYVKSSNKVLNSNDSIIYNVNVIPDAYPLIGVKERRDTLSAKLVYFVGDVSDDYGLRKLNFHYRFRNGDKADLPPATVPIAINAGATEQTFYHYFDLNEIGISPADELEYYFEVWDNDAVNGSKAARSRTMVFKAPSKKELKEQVKSNSKALKDKMEQAVEDAKDIQRELSDLQRKMMDKQELTWQEKKRIEDLLDKQKKLEKNLDEIKELNKANNFKKNEFEKQEEKLLQKQQELEKLFEELMTDEMKKLMEQMEELLKQNNKERLQEELDQMELNNEDVEKELDRMLELFKEFELEQKLEQAIEDLNELSEKQENLSEQSQDKEQKSEDLKQEQDKLNKEFQDLRMDMKEIDLKNQDLENPKDLENTDAKQDDIEQDMQESSDKLDQNKKSKASDKQKDAAKKMKELAAQMEMELQDMKKKQAAEDYDRLREILENLVQLSFDQEELMGEFKNINTYDPAYVKLNQRQRKLKDDARVIEDSLLALSKRVPQISSYVNREISKVNDNMNKSINYLGDRQVLPAQGKQQYVMTSLNNLAVMLSDVLQQMQEQMASQMKGKQMCQKPGGQGKSSKPSSIPNLKEMQEQLNKMMKDGKNPGGKQGKMGNKKWAQMAARQEAIRRKLQQMRQKLEKEGNGAAGRELRKMEDLMEQTERDLVNQKLTEQTLRRQKEIMTRMLESEKAEQEREQDNKREAEQAKDKEIVIPPTFEDYLKQKRKEAELLKTISPELAPYYKQRAKEYFNKIGN